MTSSLTGARQTSSGPELLARKALSDPSMLPELLRGLGASVARQRFACAKALHLLSQQRPQMLYPYFDDFVRLLDHENRIYQWEAMFVLSHLARRRSRKQIPGDSR